MQLERPVERKKMLLTRLKMLNERRSMPQKMLLERSVPRTMLPSSRNKRKSGRLRKSSLRMLDQRRSLTLRRRSRKIVQEEKREKPRKKRREMQMKKQGKPNGRRPEKITKTRKLLDLGNTKMKMLLVKRQGRRSSRKSKMMRTNFVTGFPSAAVKNERIEKLLVPDKRGRLKMKTRSLILTSLSARDKQK